MSGTIQTMRYPSKPPSVQLSATAHQSFSEELATLKQELVAVMERLQTAREMGDLSENGAYKYAKLELGTIRRRIRELTSILENSSIIEKKNYYSVVELGCRVTLSDGESSQTWEIVGQYEANPLEYKISLQSPLGTALANKKAGDTVSVTTPNGTAHYTITAIQ